MLVTESNFAEGMRKIIGRKELAVDLETSGLFAFKTPKQSKICGIAVFNGEESVYFSFRHSNSENLTNEQKQQVLDVLGTTPLLINHNIKFDLRFLSVAGMATPECVIDTMLGLYLLNENQSLALKVSSDRIFGTDSSQEELKLKEILMGWGYAKDEMWRLPAQFVAPYAEKDTVLTWKLREHLEKNLSKSLRRPWDELNTFVITMLKAEAKGIHVDPDILAKHESEAQLAALLLDKRLKEQFGRGFDPASPAVVARTFQLPDSTEETLLAVKSRPGVLDLLDYRSWRKATDTYYKQYRTAFMDVDNCIHSEFKIAGTVTGRLSSRDPNLQAVPRRSESQKVKDVFTARPGKRLLEADYSQAEIRVAAHYTREQTILNAIREGKDIHQAVATEVGISRQEAKTLNFAMIYGAGAKRLAQTLGYSIPKASKLLAGYHAKYPGYKRLTRACEQVASERGYVEMWNKRRRHFDTQDSEPHTAFNAIIQGGVAQMVIGAMNELDAELPDHAQILVQVHDSILVECDEDKVEEVVGCLKEVMIPQPQFSVPMDIDIKEGQSWGALEKYVAK